MKEIEAKFLDINKAEIVKKLESMGARKAFEGRVSASYFDTRRYHLQRKGLILRLRMRGDGAEITMKRKISRHGAKIMEENESMVGDFAEMKSILVGLGYAETVIRIKHRTSYIIDRTHFEIDEIENVPAFLEIEAPDVEGIKKAAESIGLDMKDAKPWSEGDVRRHYADKK